MRCAVVIIVLAVIGCDDRSARQHHNPTKVVVSATKPAGMTKYAYLSGDTGPQMLLPSSAAGVDYARARALTADRLMAVMPADSGTAIVLGSPPMTALGKSRDGLVEIYYLHFWKGTDLDGLIDTASAALATESLTDSGELFQLGTDDAVLAYAGVLPKMSHLSPYRVKLAAGTYRILTGEFSERAGAVTVYRLKPKS